MSVKRALVVLGCVVAVAFLVYSVRFYLDLFGGK